MTAGLASGAGGMALPGWSHGPVPDLRVPHQPKVLKPSGSVSGSSNTKLSSFIFTTWPCRLLQGRPGMGVMRSSSVRQPGTALLSFRKEIYPIGGRIYPLTPTHQNNGLGRRNNWICPLSRSSCPDGGRATGR